MSKSDNGRHPNRITPGHPTGQSAGILRSGRKIFGPSRDVDPLAVVFVVIVGLPIVHTGLVLYQVTIQGGGM